MSANLPRPASDALVSDMLDAYRDDEGFGEDVRRLAARIQQDRRRMDAVRAYLLNAPSGFTPSGAEKTPYAQGVGDALDRVRALLDGDGEARP